MPSNQAVLRRDIPWGTYMSARLLSDKDLQLIRKFDNKSEATQSQLLEEDGSAYVDTFMTVIRNVTKEETVQYVLAHLDNIISGDPSRAALFHQGGLTGGFDPYTLFLRLLQRNDWFTQSRASRLLVAVLNGRPNKRSAVRGSTSTVSAADEGVQATQVAYVEWLCSQLRRPSHPTRSVPAVVGDLASALQDADMRHLYTRSGGVQMLAPLLERGVTSGSSASLPNQQLLYDTGMCTWELSYHPPAAKLMPSCGIPKGLVALVRSGVKEKVVRVALLAIKNLLSDADLHMAPAVVDLGLHKFVAIRSLQSWEDEDIPTLLEDLSRELRDNILVLSNFELYRKEILSGQLQWTPMHTSEQFWKENVNKFEEKDFQVLKQLLKVVESEVDGQTLAVACHDVGSFIQYFPAGKGIVTALHGKEAVLRLVAHDDPAVQKQALLASQKILLSRDKADFLANLDSGLSSNGIES